MSTPYKSQFGGIPVEDEPFKSQFGGVPVDEAPTPQTIQEPGFTEKFKNFWGGSPTQTVHPIPGFSDTSVVTQFFNAPFQGQRQMVSGAKKLATPSSTLGQRASGASDILTGGVKQFAPAAAALLPAAVSAPIPTAALVGLGAAGAGIGGATGRGLAGLVSDDEGVKELGGTTGTILGGAIAGPLGMAGARTLGTKVAGGLSRSALPAHVRERAFGADQGMATLQETTGIRPKTIAQSAKQRIADLAQGKQQALALSRRVPLAPAQGRASAQKALATVRGDPNFHANVSSMEDQLTRNLITGTPYPPEVDPELASDILKGFNSFQGKPNEFRGPGDPTQAAIEDVGGTLRNTIRDRAPGLEEYNSRIHNLSAVPDIATMASHAPGVVQSAVNRSTRYTGGLFPAIAGLFHSGIPGGLGVMGAQEALSSPIVKMALARALFRGAGGQKLAVPELMQGPRVAPTGWTPPPRALLPSGPIAMPGVANPSGPTGRVPQPGSGISPSIGSRALAAPGPIPQGGFATGTTSDLVPFKHPVTGKIEYVPEWMLQGGQ